MPRTQAKLASELLAVVPVADAVQAAQNFAAAYGTYMKDATANAVPANAAYIDSTLVPSMATAMAFLADDTAAGGAAKLVTGHTAFWTPAVAAPSALFAGATVIVPPTFAALAAALVATFTANLERNQADAMDALATDIHTATGLSPTAQFGVPVFPIL